MKNHRYFIIAITAVLLIIVAACSFSASTANIKNAYTARDDNGVKQQTAVFAQDDVIYCMVEVANAPDDTTTKAMWYAVDAEGMDPNYFIAEAEVVGGGELTFDLANNDMLWPVGKYKVELYLNGELVQALDFSVIGGVTSAAPGTEASVVEEFDEEIFLDESTFACDISSDVKTEWVSVLCDHFDDNSFAWYEGLDISDLGTVDVTITEGQYVVDVLGKPHSGYSSGIVQWFGIGNMNNFVASIDGRITSKFRGATWGFNFRGKGMSFYSFGVGKEGQYYLDMLKDGQWSRLIKVKTNNAIKWDDAVNNLTVVADGNRMMFYVNGTLVDTYDSEQSFGDELSLFINVDEGASAKFYFDDALVRVGDF